MHWQKVALIGLGLLGGSLGLALKRRSLARQVAGFVRRQASVQECLRRGVVDLVAMDLEPMVTGAELIILCTPIGQMRELTKRMLPALRPGVVVTDVGSVKAPVVRELEPLLAGVGACFVGSHPMAGGEKAGVEAAREDLFEEAVCAITPSAGSSGEAVGMVEELWRLVGALPVRVAPEVHDDLVGRCSHLPHVLAAQLVNLVLGPNRAEEQALLCGPGFRDTTRIASGATEMWRDICQANRENLGRVLGELIESLRTFRSDLEQGNWSSLEDFFDQARRRREAWVRRGPPAG